MTNLLNKHPANLRCSAKPDCYNNNDLIIIIVVVIIIIILIIIIIETKTIRHAY
jgi:uncharacterized integral membrane protein